MEITKQGAKSLRIEMRNAELQPLAARLFELANYSKQTGNLLCCLSIFTKIKLLIMDILIMVFSVVVFTSSVQFPPL